jgi:hypothetical protein
MKHITENIKKTKHGRTNAADMNNSHQQRSTAASAEDGPIKRRENVTKQTHQKQEALKYTLDRGNIQIINTYHKLPWEMNLKYLTWNKEKSLIRN